MAELIELKLDLSDNRILCEGLIEIGKGLTNLTNLKLLDLNFA